MKHYIKLFALIFVLVSFSIPPKGEFVGKVVVEWLDNGRQMKLLEDFAYIDPDGKNWKAPKGTIIDGASIPRLFWSLIGGPFEGGYRNASVIHDYYCEAPYKEPWEKVHRMFYDACITGGIPELKAKVMYAAVYAGGPRWKVETIHKRPGNRIEYDTIPFKVNTPKDDFEEIKIWIENNNPDLSEIDKRLDPVIQKDNFLNKERR